MSTLPRSLLVAIGRAVQAADGDMDDVDHLVAAWKRLQADAGGRVDRMRAEAARPACCCAQVDHWLAEVGPDGRCERCHGVTTRELATEETAPRPARRGADGSAPPRRRAR